MCRVSASCEMAVSSPWSARAINFGCEARNLDLSVSIAMLNLFDSIYNRRGWEGVLYRVQSDLIDEPCIRG